MEEDFRGPLVIVSVLITYSDSKAMERCSVEALIILPDLVFEIK
jgi:hypothetical protein